MFVIQRVLEQDGRMTLLDTNKVITPNPNFSYLRPLIQSDLAIQRVFIMERNRSTKAKWIDGICNNTELFKSRSRMGIILSKSPDYDSTDGKSQIDSMVALADLTRQGFMAGDIRR